MVPLIVCDGIGLGTSVGGLSEGCSGWLNDALFIGLKKWVALIGIFIVWYMSFGVSHYHHKSRTIIPIKFFYNSAVGGTKLYHTSPYFILGL